VALTDVCDFQGGTQPPKSEWSKERKNGFIRMLQIRDFTQGKESFIEYVKENKTLKTCQANDVLIGRYGASIGKILTGLEGAYNVAMVKTIPDNSKICSSFLIHLLRGNSFQRFIVNVGSRAAQAGFNKKELEKFKFVLPSLPEQQKIAAILDAADSLRQKDQQLIEHYTALSQSLFLEMFGDPVGNQHNFPKGTIRDLVTSVNYGTSSKAQIEGEYPYLRMNNITYQGEMNFNSLKYITLSEKEKPKFLVEKGDILFNRTNSKELVGKTGLFLESEKMAIAGYLIRVRTNEKANPYFIWGYMNSKHGKLTLQHMCKSIVGMANINAQEFQNIKIVLPPVELQNKFAQRIAAIKQQKQKAQANLEKSEELFNSLLQRAFKGELTAISTSEA